MKIINISELTPFMKVFLGLNKGKIEGDYSRGPTDPNCCSLPIPEGYGVIEMDGKSTIVNLETKEIVNLPFDFSV